MMKQKKMRRSKNNLSKQHKKQEAYFKKKVNKIVHLFLLQVFDNFIYLLYNEFIRNIEEYYCSKKRSNK